MSIRLYGNWRNMDNQEWVIPEFKRFTVTVPVVVNEKTTGMMHQINVVAQTEKEAIKLAKRHIRKQLTQSFKMVKAYE